MKSAALILGIIGGLIAMIVGFFVYGYTVAIDSFGEVPDLLEQANNPGRLRAIGLISPILAIAGGAMAVLRPRIAAALLAAGHHRHLVGPRFRRVHHVPDLDVRAGGDPGAVGCRHERAGRDAGQLTLSKSRNPCNNTLWKTPRTP